MCGESRLCIQKRRCAPEVWDPGGAASLPKNYEGAPALMLARQRDCLSEVGKARRRRPTCAARAAFASSNGVFAPEVWDPGGAASLPKNYEGAPALMLARQRDCLSEVGKARRRRPTCAARAAFASSNGVFAPEAWDPDGAASLPKIHEVLPHRLQVVAVFWISSRRVMPPRAAATICSSWVGLKTFSSPLPWSSTKSSLSVMTTFISTLASRSSM